MKWIVALLVSVALAGCVETVLEASDPAGFSPPGELLVAPSPLTRLDSSKPMPLPEFMEQVAMDIEHDRDVSIRLSQLQFWGRSHSGWSKPVTSDLDDLINIAAAAAGGKTEIPQSEPEVGDP